VKDFSLFERAQTLSSLGNPLAQDSIASISRRDFNEQVAFTCHTTSSSIEYACLMIENALLLRTNRGGRVYAGFEQLSAFQPVIDRYLRIADLSETVYLFGKNDWKPPRHPNVRIIPLMDDFRIARESFVITLSSSLTTAFVSKRDEAIPPTRDQQLHFAIKTSDVSTVLGLADGIECVIDWSIAA